MDDDSDDEYFNRLQEHADKLPEYQTSELPSCDDDEPITFRNDDEYYNHVNDHNTNLSASILPENDLIWQEMIRSNVAFSKTNDTWLKIELTTSDMNRHTTEILLVEQWLFSHLPQSCRLYNLLVNRDMHRYFFTSSHLYVDNVQHPSLVILIYQQISNPFFVNTSMFVSPGVCNNNKETYETVRVASNTIIDEYRKMSVLEHHDVPNPSTNQSKSALSLLIETNNDNVHNTLIQSFLREVNLIETTKSNINGLYVLNAEVTTNTNSFIELPTEFKLDQLR